MPSRNNQIKLGNERTLYGRAFTLIELLVVIAIIGILAALLLPALAAAKKAAQVKKAKMEISQLANAITRYETTYSRYPTGQNPGSNDFTYGYGAIDNILAPTTPDGTNSEVVAILMDAVTYPATGLPTINTGHVKNTQQIKFLNASMASTTNDPGVGPDLVYRDPWGKPYIISMDLNYNENTQDAVYMLKNVSQQTPGQATGYNGLVNISDNTGNSDDYEYHGGVMVWSLGPDKQASLNTPPNNNNAVQGVNKDNVVSWTQ